MNANRIKVIKYLLEVPMFTLFVRNFFRYFLFFISLSFVPLCYAMEKPKTSCDFIRVTGNNDYPPLIWQDASLPESLTGVLIDLQKKVLSNINLQVSTRYMGNWARAQLETKNGNADILLAPYLTKERQSWLNYFPTPIMSDPVHLAFKSDNYKEIQSWQALTNLVGASPRGNSYGEKFDLYARQHLSIFETNTLEESFNMLLKGRADYVIYGLYPMMSTSHLMEINQQIVFSKKAISAKNLYFSMARSSGCNRYFDRISRELEHLVQTGYMDNLIDRYLKKWRVQQKGSKVTLIQ